MKIWINRRLALGLGSCSWISDGLSFEIESFFEKLCGCWGTGCHIKLLTVSLLVSGWTKQVKIDSFIFLWSLIQISPPKPALSPVFWFSITFISKNKNPAIWMKTHGANRTSQRDSIHLIKIQIEQNRISVYSRSPEINVADSAIHTRGQNLIATTRKTDLSNCFFMDSFRKVAVSGSCIPNRDLTSFGTRTQEQLSTRNKWWKCRTCFWT